MFCPKLIPITGPPLPKPQARRKPLLLFLPLPPPPRVSSTQLFFLQLYPPGSLHNWLIRFFFFFFFFFTFFPQASLICQAKALEGLCLRERGGHGIVSLIGKCSPRYPRNQKPREFERWGGGGNRSLSPEEGLPSFIFSPHLIGETAHQGIAPAPSLC